jgi:signal transduction histidine kinase
LESCCADLRNQYPQYPDDQLVGQLPTFLDQFIAALRADVTGGSEDPPQPAAVATAAVQQAIRKNHGFDQSRLIYDVGLLCEKVTEIGSLHGETFGAREFQIFNRCIDDAIAKTVDSFSEQAGNARLIERRERREHLASFAHELRNALGNAMAGFDLIRKGRVAAHGSTANVVGRARSRIAAMLPDMLAETHLRDKLLLEPEQLQLGALLAQLSSEAFPERGIRIQLNVPENSTVIADARLLTSALTNIIQNAIKFTRDNGIVSVRAQENENGISIEIEDMCSGLPDGSAEDLFKPLSKSIAMRRGMGLGLAIARRVVQEHDGRITIRNLPGVGCGRDTAPIQTPLIAEPPEYSASGPTLQTLTLSRTTSDSIMGIIQEMS